jgi:hypothetical protein
MTALILLSATIGGTAIGTALVGFLRLLNGKPL